jgi:hypothetical protein
MGLDCYLCKVVDIEELNFPKFKILGDLEDSISDDITYFLKSELLGEDATSYSKNFYKKYKNYFVNIKIPHWDLKSFYFTYEELKLLGLCFHQNIKLRVFTLPMRN